MEAINIIEEINKEIFELLDNKNGYLGYLDEYYWFDLQYKTDGCCEVIEFMNIPIWNSDEDEREWDDIDDDYEPLKPFLIKQIKKYCEYTEIINGAIGNKNE